MQKMVEHKATKGAYSWFCNIWRNAQNEQVHLNITIIHMNHIIYTNTVFEHLVRNRRPMIISTSPVKYSADCIHKSRRLPSSQLLLRCCIWGGHNSSRGAMPCLPKHIRTYRVFRQQIHIAPSSVGETSRFTMNIMFGKLLLHIQFLALVTGIDTFGHIHVVTGIVCTVLCKPYCAI